MTDFRTFLASAAGFLRRARLLAILTMGAAALAGCAQQSKVAGSSNGKEHFAEGQYGRASPRVVADGEAVPRGGGQYLVGRPYKIAGRTYYPREPDGSFSQTGMASWYGGAFHGRRTANGEVYDMRSISAAHPTMPLPSYARVTNLGNGRSMIVRVNDRGPYHSGRVMDVSSQVAEVLDFKRMGTARVKVEYVGRADLAGSDDRKLMASLRTDGRPASIDGFPNAPVTALARNDAPRAGSATESQPLLNLFGGAAAPAPRNPAPATSVVERTSPVIARKTTDDPDPIASLIGVKPAIMPRRPPLPPSRPFDLATIPGAGVPVAAPRMRQASAVFFAPDDSLATRLGKSGPFVVTGARAFRKERGPDEDR